MLDLWAALLQFRGQCAVIEAAEITGADVAARLTGVGKMLDLGNAVRRQRIQRNDAHPEHAENQRDEFRHVGQLHDHAVATLQAHGLQPYRHFRGAGIQFRVGEAFAFPHHRHPHRIFLGTPAQPGTEGFVAPVAGLTVAFGQDFGPWLVQLDGRVHREAPAAGEGA